VNPIKQYTIIRSPSISKLATEVNIRIDSGWEPIGGIAVDAEGEHYQAMIKRRAPESDRRGV
jgi:hypothetical protein